MSYGAANRIFHGNGSYSPFGTTLPSGSHLGNKNYYYSIADNRGVHETVIDFRDGGHGCCYNYSDYNMFGGGCCGGSGIDGKTAAWVFGASTCVGFLASPLGAKVIGGIGKACSWLWNKAITPAAKWTWNSVIKPTGKAIGKAASWTWNSVIKPAGQGIGNFFKGCWNWMTGKGWDGTK